MARIDWNDIYQTYLSETEDPFKAVEYTVFGRLTGSKKVPKVFTIDEWIDTSAPSYKTVLNYKGPDEATKIISGELNRLKTSNVDFDLGQVNEISTKLSNVGYTKGEAYDIVKGIYDEYARAKKSYSLQSGSNWWKQYDLPDPSLRYDGTTNKLDQAEDYIAKQSAAYANKIKGDPNASARAADFNKAIRASVYKKINDAGVTPFAIASQKRIKTRG